MNILIIVAILLLISISITKSKKKKERDSEIKIRNNDGFVDKKYNSLDDWKSDLKVLWSGKPFDIEFTYESKSGKMRRSITLKQVATNIRNELYLIGTCHTRGEDRTFNTENIATMIKYKSKRYSHFDFLNDVVGIDATGYAFRC